MKIYNIIVNIIQNPLIPRYYKELHDYYEFVEEKELTLAFSYLIEHKFNKNDSTNNTHVDNQ